MLTSSKYPVFVTRNRVLLVLSSDFWREEENVIAFLPSVIIINLITQIRGEQYEIH